MNRLSCPFCGFDEMRTIDEQFMAGGNSFNHITLCGKCYSILSMDAMMVEGEAHESDKLDISDEDTGGNQDN